MELAEHIELFVLCARVKNLNTISNACVHTGSLFIMCVYSALTVSWQREGRMGLN